MNIVIDTNIIRKDIKINDKNFEIIFDYLKKTKSKIIMMQIVFEEITGLYTRLLTEQYINYKTSLNKLSNTLLNNINSNINLSITGECDKYMNYLKEKLKFEESDIIKYKPEYLNDIINRAIYRKKPCDENGQQFRDAILWLSILDFAKSLNEKKVIFISENTKDFSNGKANSLSDELKLEAKNYDIEIYFYKSINDFIKEHSSKIDFISKEWLNENINLTTIKNIFNDIIEKEDRLISRFIVSDLDFNKKFINFIGWTDYIDIDLDNFYIYELMDGSLVINIEYEIEKEYEYEYEPEINKKDYENEDSMFYSSRNRIKTKCDIDIFLFIVNFIITIKNNKIVDYTLDKWELA